MGLLMMPLGTQVLNSAPRELVSRATSLTGALQNLVASLAIASFATLLQARAGTRLAETGSQPAPETIATVQALAFGDVFGTAVLVLGLAFGLVWTLRRPPAAGRVGSERGGQQREAAGMLT
jgi:uncharacterized membrane protein